MIPSLAHVPGLVAIAIVAGFSARVVGMIYRTRIRAKYMIQGGPCEDCLCHFCCACCAIAQEARHVDRDVGLLPGPIGLAYQPPV